jgi:rhomboid protease GluP
MLPGMFKRQTSGSVVCVSCGYLVGVNDEKCYHCGRRNPGLWGFAPALRSLGHDLGFVPFVTGTCVVMFVLTVVLSGTLGDPSLFGFLSPDGGILFMFGSSGAVPVFYYHRWWTVFSANWLHGGLLHIVFNLMWIRQLAPAVGEMYGPGRMVIIYVLGGAVGFVLSSVMGYSMAWMPIPFLQGAASTVGASAAIFALMGALVYYGRRSGSRMVSSQVWSMAGFAFLTGFLFRGVDNYAHLGGFAGGYVIGMVLDPLKPERIDHMLIAVICLGVSVLSILVSFITAP